MNLNFKKSDPYDWFCSPGSNFFLIHVLQTSITEDIEKNLKHFFQWKPMDYNIVWFPAFCKIPVSSVVIHRRKV